MLKSTGMTDYDLQIVSESPLFLGIKLSTLKSVASNINIYEYNRSEIIFQEKSNSTELYLILRGQVEILKNGKNDSFVVSVFSIKDFFGEMAFLTGSRRSFTAVARSDCRLLAMSHDELQSEVFSDYFIKSVLVTNIAKKLASSLDSLNHEYARLMNMNGRFFRDHHKKNLVDLSSGISRIRNKYLR